MPLSRALLLVCSWLLLGGCVSHTVLTLDERNALERELAAGAKDRYLRMSFYVTPFFGDATKRLLAAVPPEEIRMLEYPDGTPVNPGEVQKILPAGTPVRITKVEFPTAWVMAERVLYTPRIQPWIYLEASGEKGPTPLILVLRPGIKTQAEFLSDLERFLSERDPLAAGNFPEPVRAAIREKKALMDMTAEALEMSWGYPEKKQVSYEGPSRREDWIYPGGARIAHLIDGRVVALDGGKR